MAQLRRIGPRLLGLSLALALDLAAAGGGGACAGVPAAAVDRGLVDRALAYLQGLRSAEGRFTQTDSHGGTADGRFYIERPGKARFDYSGARAMLVVSDGDVVTVFDRRLKTADQYPLEQTPLQLLLADEIKLGHGVEVEAAARRPGGFVVTLRGAPGGSPGRLILDFNAEPTALAGWTVVDAQGGRTTVRLLDLERRTRLDPQLFVAGESKLTAPRF